MPLYASDGAEYEDRVDLVLGQPMPQEEAPITKTEPTARITVHPASSTDALPEPQGSSLVSLNEVPATPTKVEKEVVSKPRGVVDKLLGLTGERFKTWPEKMVNTAIEALKLPGDVAAGKVDLGSKEAMDRVTDLAGTLIFGPMPLARKVVDGTLGSFAGVGSKTANTEALNKARALDRRGETVDDIFKETGWYRGHDNKWRYEIPDQNVALKDLGYSHIKTNPKGTVTKLEDLIDHPKLFEAYPHLKEILVINDPGLKALGAAHLEENLIKLNLPKIEKQVAAQKDLGAGYRKSDVVDVILHEIQHVVQHKEGFLQGTNPRAALELSTEALYEKVKQAQTDKNVSLPEYLALSALLRKVAEHGNTKNELGTTLAESIYRRTAGEIEARNVPIRRGHSEENLKKVHPRHTEDAVVWEGAPLFHKADID